MFKGGRLAALIAIAAGLACPSGVGAKALPVWTPVATAPVGQDAILNAVGGAAANDRWAVGSQGAQPKALAEHWDGTAWSVVGTQDPGTTDALNGVSAAGTSAVWAVGSQTTGGVTSTLIER